MSAYESPWMTDLGPSSHCDRRTREGGAHFGCATDCQCRAVRECVQIHGGYGYMTGYPIARMWMDSRVQRIYARSNEILQELIGWSL